MIDAIMDLAQLLLLMGLIFALFWITNSHIDRVEVRMKKYIEELLKNPGELE